VGKHKSSRMFWLVAVLAAMLASGCASQPNKYESETRRQQELIDNLTGENQRLQADADQARQAAAAAQQQASSAESEMAALRARPAPGRRAAPIAEPEGAAVGHPAGGARFTLESKLAFSLGKSELTIEGQRALRRIAATIKSDSPGKYIRIEGHTDSVPIKSVPGKTNMDLSVERALAVWRYLVDQCAVDPKKLYIAGYGQYRPVASNRTERGRQTNRRVEIVVVDE